MYEKTKKIEQGTVGIFRACGCDDAGTADRENEAHASASGERSVKDTHQLTYYDTRYNEGGLRVGYFEIDGGIPAMCVCHELDSPTKAGTTLVTNAVYTAENHGNDLMRKIYYYGWRGRGCRSILCGDMSGRFSGKRA